MIYITVVNWYRVMYRSKQNEAVRIVMIGASVKCCCRTRMDQMYRYGLLTGARKFKG